MPADHAPAPSFSTAIDAARQALTQGLNPAQAEAVAAPAGHRLVLAGAGSGKTRVLTHRIAWLMAVDHASPWSILAVTFTNKAAAEMRHRLESLIVAPVRQMWVGTFHGLCHKFLRLHWRDAGLPQTFQIMDSDDQSRMVRRVVKALNIDDTRLPVKQAVGFINQQKEDARRARDLPEPRDLYQKDLARIYAAYEEQCRITGQIDFAELLLRVFELLRDDEGLRAHYRDRFRHILVDEFQDTNRLQYAWLKLLAGAAGTVFAVGDDDQSIYGWRGARIENIQNFAADFPGADTTRLEENYRSTANILSAANALIARNHGRLGKTLRTSGPPGEKLHIFAAYNDRDEAEFVIAQTQSLLAKPDAGLGGKSLRRTEVAILYRSNAQSRVFEEALIRARLPYRIHGGLRFFERAEIKDAMAWLRLLANRADDASFERALATPPSGVGATTLERLRTEAQARGTSLWDTSIAAGALLSRSGNALAAFRERLDRLAAETAALPLGQRMKRVIEVAGLTEHFAKEKGEQAESRVENLKELVTAAEGFERPQDGPEAEMEPLTAFLAHAALEAGEAAAKAGEDAIQLMTLHAAKGLEFPVVFMVGLENGLFPSQRAIDEGNLEEERRLCYVGITRARTRLFISHAESRRIYGRETPAAPSTFLKDLPPEVVLETRPRSGILRPGAGLGAGFGVHQATTYDLNRAARLREGGGNGGGTNWPGRPSAAATPARAAAAPDPFHSGDRVRHARFGEGVVVGTSGSGERFKVEINFAPEHGRKELLAALARLEKL